jgi:PAS domain S-box-containing protein
MYGYDRPEEIVGARLGDLMPADDPANHAYLRAFIENGYRLDVGESHEVDREGRPRVFENTLTGEVEGGCVVRAWGTQRDVTERKAAERDRALLAAIVASSDDAIVSKTLDGVITSWNAGAERIFGYTAEEAVGQPVLMLIPPERRDEEDLILGRIRRGERVEHFETVRLTKDGRLIDVSLTISPVRDDAGRIVGASKVARDVTAQKAAERALRASEEHLRMALQVAPVIITRVDADLRYEWSYNTAAESATDAIGRRAEDFMPPEEAAALTAFKREVLESGQPRRRELTFTLPDGPHTFDMTAEPVRDEDGPVVGVITATFDITERTRAEEALRASEERFRLAASAFTGMVYDWDVPTGEVFRSEGLYGLVGVRPEDVPDDPSWWAERVHPDDRAHVYDLLRTVLETDAGHYAVEYRVRHEGGRWVHLWDRGFIVRDEAGRALRVIGSATDVTERRRAEEALRASEERFRLAVSNDVLTLYEQDADLRYVWVYPQHPEFPEANVGRTDAELVPGEGGAHLMRLKRRVLETGVGLREEVGVALPDGLRWYDLVVEPRRDDGGRIVGVAGVALDVTDRKWVEAALRESEERQRLALDAAQVGTWTLDLTTGRADGDARLLEIIGEAPGADLSPEASLERRAHPDDRAHLEAALAAALDPAGDGRFAETFRIRRPDGAERWVALNGLVSFVSTNGDRHPVRMVGTARDVTGEQEAEAALRESEARFRTLADSAPVLIWVNGLEGAEFVNRAYLDFLGVGEVDVRGYDWARFIHPEDREGYVGAYLDAVARGVPFEAQFRFRRHDGAYRWMRSVGVPRRSDAGALLGYVGSTADVTDFKLAEARALLLAETGRLIEQALDYEGALEEIARVAVPGFADWCAVDLLHADGSISAAAIAHADPEKVHWAWALREREPMDPDAPTGAPNVIRTGQPERYPVVTDEMLVAAARDEEHLRLMREIGFSSVLIAPMRAGGEVIGAISFVQTESGRHFDEADLATAEEIARRAGAAIETARLHGAVQENAERLRAVIETAVDGIITIDERGTVETMNPAAVRIFGYEPEEVVGRNVRMLMPEPYHAEHDGYIANYLLTGERKIIGIGREVEGRRKDGSTFPMELAVSETHLDGRRLFTGLVRDITERKEAERLIRFQAHLLDTVEQAVIATDVDGRVVYWNRYAEALYGWTAGEAEGRPILDLTPAPEARAEAAAIMDVLRAGRSWTGEIPLRRRDGATFPAYVIDTPVHDDAGRLVGVVGVSFDLTERKAAEAALEASERQLRLVTDTIPALVSYVDAGQRYRFVNRAYTDWLGHAPEEVLGHPLREVLGEAAYEAIRPEVEAVLAGERVVYERQLPYRDGGSRFVRASYIPDEGPDGAVRGFFALVLDVTEEKRAEQALRESEARFRQLAEALPQIVYTLPARREGADTEYLNAEWFAYTGMPPGTSYREALPDVVHPDDLPRVRGAWTRAEEGGTPMEMELRLRRHDGAYRWFLTRLVPVRGGDGRIARWFGTSTDIHAQKETEAELAERVAERTAELERSNRELDQFAYIASHDLKAPLRGIDNLATWIAQDARDALPEDSRRHLDLLQGRVQRLEQLLESLLVYSRAGRTTGLAERVDTAALVQGIVELLDFPPSFTVEVEEPLPTLTTYLAPLELVFRNLLSNASKHGRADGRVRVSARDAGVSGAGPEAGRFVEFAVADDGPGIPAQYHERIFGLFQTLRPRDEVEGSGMGLAVVKKTVESLGGTARVESTEGAGTTFYFTWPRAV